MIMIFDDNIGIIPNIVILKLFRINEASSAQSIWLNKVNYKATKCTNLL